MLIKCPAFDHHFQALSDTSFLSATILRTRLFDTLNHVTMKVWIFVDALEDTKDAKDRKDVEQFILEITALSNIVVCITVDLPPASSRMFP